MRPRFRALGFILSALLAAGLFAAWAAPALADSVGFDGPNVVGLDDDDGDDDSTITVTANKGSVVFTSNDPIDTVDPECTPDGGTTVTCTAPDIIFYFVDLDNGNDTVTANGALGGDISGDDGNDNITGSNENRIEEFLDGGDGNDIINSRNVGLRDTSIGFASSTPRGRAAGTDGAPIDPAEPVGDIVEGQDGNDQTTSGNGNDEVSGDNNDDECFINDGDLPAVDTGTDVVSTGPGADFGHGGPGDNDQVNLGEGDDFTCAHGNDGTGDAADGGPGIDELEFDNTTFPANPGVDPFNPDDFTITMLTGATSVSHSPAQSDTNVNFEDVFTEDGDDAIGGTEGSNDIFTDNGNDFVNPLGGADQLELWIGNDGADTRDGFQDTVRCGDGADSVDADQFDILADCESVRIGASRAGADIAAPDDRHPGEAQLRAERVLPRLQSPRGLQ